MRTVEDVIFLRPTWRGDWYNYIVGGKLIALVSFSLGLPQMSQHSGHTDSDGMISDMAEGSGAWRSDFNDDSDFGADGSGSGDGYSGKSSGRELSLKAQNTERSNLLINPFSCLFLSFSGLSKVPVPERPTYQPPVVVHNNNDRNDHSGASVNQLHAAMLLAINVLTLLLLRSH